jgi:hypothetical protein
MALKKVDVIAPRKPINFNAEYGYARETRLVRPRFHTSLYPPPYSYIILQPYRRLYRLSTIHFIRDLPI